MSRKSGFSKGLPHEGPCVERELPHHTQALRWRGLVELSLLFLIRKSVHTDNTISHGQRHLAESRCHIRNRHQNNARTDRSIGISSSDGPGRDNACCRAGPTSFGFVTRSATTPNDSASATKWISGWTRSMPTNLPCLAGSLRKASKPDLRIRYWALL